MLKRTQGFGENKRSCFRKTEIRTRIWARKIHYKPVIHYKWGEILQSSSSQTQHSHICKPWPQTQKGCALICSVWFWEPSVALTVSFPCPEALVSGHWFSGLDMRRHLGAQTAKLSFLYACLSAGRGLRVGRTCALPSCSAPLHLYWTRGHEEHVNLPCTACL